MVETWQMDVATVPPTIALARTYFGEDGAIVFGWVNAAHQLGAGGTAFLGGVMRDLVGTYDLVWIGAAGLCAVAALVTPQLKVTAPQVIGFEGRPR